MLIFLALGILSVSLYPVLPSYWFIFGFLLIAIATWYFRQRWISMIVIGIAYGSLYGHYLVERQLSPDLDGEQLTIRGQVVGLPENHPDRRRFYIRVKTVISNQPEFNRLARENLQGKKMLLSWYANHIDSDEVSIIPELTSGDYWQLTVKLKRPRGFVNPYGFDYQLYLLKKQVAANGYVRTSKNNHLIENRCHFLNMGCWREIIRQWFAQNIVDKKYLGLLLALAIGDRQQITESQWNLLQETGTVHLMAISGLHIGLAASIGFLIGRLFAALFHYFLANGQIGLFLPSIFSLFFAFFYSALAGWSLPTQRALIMVVLFHVFSFFYRKPGPWFVLSSTLCLVAIIDPLMIYDRGAWLSFLAVFSLLFCFIGYRKKQSNLPFFARFYQGFIDGLKSQWVITLGLLLPGIVLMQGMSLLSPLTNVVAIPIVSVIIVPALLLTIFSFSSLPKLAESSLALANDVVNLLVQFLDFCHASLPAFWVFEQARPMLGIILLGFIGVAGLLLPKGIIPRWLVLLCLLPVFFPPTNHSPLVISFLDVGQGTAVVVETSQHILVYDTGQKYSSRFDVGKHIIAPYLIKRGYSEIDRIVISHSDGDHAGGLEGLLSELNAKSILSGEPEYIKSEPCIAGDQWQWSEVNFSVLWPDKKAKNFFQKDNNNNHSCVLLINIGSKQILLSGDIEKSVERFLLKDNDLNDIDILLAPHHGSRTSSHQHWVDTLKTKVVVFTAGHNNYYGHPHADVQKRYRKAKANLYNTSQHGAVQFVFDGEGNYRTLLWREKYRRYWY